jgi:DNA-directed RNA polymerase beta' subunit
MAETIRSYGQIEKPDTYNYRTSLPEKRGMYSEEVFGPLGPNDRICKDSRSALWGHINIVPAVPHPGKKGKKISQVNVPPPTARQFQCLNIFDR